MALHELRRYHPEMSIIQHLAPGYLFIQADVSFDQLTLPWRHKLPIYLHHLFPVHQVRSIRPADLTSLQQAIQTFAPPAAAIQIRSTEDDLIASRMQQLFPIVEPTGQVVSVLLTRSQAYMGVSWGTQNISRWAGGQAPITQAVSNRAGYKLLEALDAFAIRLRPGEQALDLGAAPGAWTTILRERGLKVTAIAPAPLYPWLRLDPQVDHQPMLAEEFLEQCQTTFDLIVNDMVLDAQDSARLMVEYATHLRSEGIAIMSLKLRERHQVRVIDHALRLLRKTYKIIQIRQLISNKKEVTLFLRRKD